MGERKWSHFGEENEGTMTGKCLQRSTRTTEEGGRRPHGVAQSGQKATFNHFTLGGREEKQVLGC